MESLLIIRKRYKLILTICIPFLISPIFIWKGVKQEPKLTENDLTNGTTSSSYKQPHCAFTILLMALYWMTECIPLAITSLIPLVLFPIFGILSSDSVSNEYLNKTTLFLLGGCIIALSFEYSNLHTRIALKVILLLGARIPNLLLGLMTTSMFLSMWMNNISCTTMTIPIVNVIMEEFNKKMNMDSSFTSEFGFPEKIGEVNLPLLNRNLHPTDGAENVTDSPMPSSSTKSKREKDVGIVVIHNSEDGQRIPEAFHNVARLPVPAATNHVRAGSVTSSTSGHSNKHTDEIKNLKTMFLIATAYAANIGGTGVITGTGTNLIAVDQLDKIRDEINEKGSQYSSPKACIDGEFLRISFLGWMQFNMFPMILNTLFCWLYLQVHFLGFPLWLRFWRKKTRDEQEKDELKQIVAKNIKKAISRKYHTLGPMKMHEILVLVIFLIMTFLWVFRDPKLFPGWESLFTKGMLKDATPTLLVCIFLFAIPKETKYFKSFLSGGLGEGLKDPLLTWEFVSRKLPWGPFLLVGGGGAMAAGSKTSGLNEFVGDLLKQSTFLQSAEPWSILLIVMLIVCLLTTVASNTATAAILSPVLISLAIRRGIHPLYLLIPPTVSASYAFILPVSTPPNAIVFDTSDMKQIDMVSPGLWVTVICNIVLFISTNTILELIFNFSSYNGECNMLK